jgi:hypothetical protein
MIGYYVTVREGKRVGFLAGPFAELGTAESVVEPVRQEAIRHDERAHFHEFGTTRVKAAKLPRGTLNARLGYVTLLDPL